MIALALIGGTVVAATLIIGAVRIARLITPTTQKEPPHGKD